MAKKKAAYWKKKCDSLYARIICSVGHCAICGRTNVRLQCHHLIGRAAVFFRHNLNNGICLCAACHNFNFGQHDEDGQRISAHGTPWAFERWMEKHRPDQHAWWSKNRHKIFTGMKINYEQVYSVLVDEAKKRGLTVK